MSQHLQPGDGVPEDGDYVVCSVFGTPTDMRGAFKQGERLPNLPRGFTWKRIHNEGRSQANAPKGIAAPGNTAQH